MILRNIRNKTSMTLSIVSILVIYVMYLYTEPSYKVMEVFTHTADDGSRKELPLLLKRRPAPLQHVVFIKTHKSAGSTVQNILMRYGLAHNLTFVLPKGSSNKLGWPDSFHPTKHMRPIKTGKPDILCHHSVFSPTMANVMPADTFYFSIIREPFSVLRSFYVYFNWQHCSGKSLSEIIKGFPESPKICKMNAYNPMMLDLGFNVSQLLNSSKSISDYIEMLDRKLQLVMIVEYFDESLIVLRDLLGWSNDDVIAFSTNFRGSENSATEPLKAIPGVDMTDSNSSRALLYQKAEADAKLYSHFKSKLEKIINANKSYIMREKRKLQNARAQWMSHCIKDIVPKNLINDPRFEGRGYGTYGYILTSEGLRNQTCIDLAISPIPFLRRLDAYQSFGRNSSYT